MSDKPSYEELQQRIIILEKQASIYKKALKNFKKNRALSGKIIAESNCIILGLDKNRRIVLFNKGAETLTGFKTGEVLGRNWFELFLKPDIHKEMEKTWKSAWGVKFHSYVNPIQTKNGDEKIISWHSTGIYDSEDDTEHILISFGEDITEKRIAEKKLYRHLEFTRTLLKSIPIPIFYKDHRGVYLGCNPAFTFFTGISYKALKDKTDKDFWPKNKADIICRKDLELIENKKKYTGTIKIPDKDGVLRPCMLFKNPFFDEKGSIKGIICAFIDLSEKQQKEDEFKKFAAVIEQAAEEVIITDAKGNIQYVNPRFEKNTGFTKDEVLGKSPKILKSGFCDDLFYKNIWMSVLEKKIWKGKLINRAKDGRQIIYDATITSIIDSSSGEVKAFVSVRRDITEQKSIEKQLRQAHKMEAIGTLAGGIAHDFNTILAGIMGYAELVIEDLTGIESPPAVIERIENVIKSAERARNLIRQILTFSRSDDEDLHPVNVNLLIKEVAILLRASIPTTIRITMPLASDLFVMSNPVNIHQILMNICTNAKDAMEETGGLLSISTMNVTLNETFLTAYQDIKPGIFCLISIEDTGKGMDKDIIKKIMEPFFTTKLQNNGTGLGLFVVHGIVKKLGGFINITSKRDTGTKFDVYLPACKKPDNEDDQFVKNEIKGGTESIICVDDEPTHNIICKELLSGLGYKVTTFDNSCKAIEFFNKNRDKYDLVIADITMPDITGDAMVKKMRDVRPELPVILCTAGPDTGFNKGEKIKKMNINALLLKPVRLKKLALVVRDVLDGETKWQES